MILRPRAAGAGAGADRPPQLPAPHARPRRVPRLAPLLRSRRQRVAAVAVVVLGGAAAALWALAWLLSFALTAEDLQAAGLLDPLPEWFTGVPATALRRGNKTATAAALAAVAAGMAEPLCADPPACAGWAWLPRDSAGGGGAGEGPLVALGVPSTDDARGREYRAAQRDTWMALGGVARRANGFAGPLLPLYLLGEHHARAGRGPSDALRAEAAAHADVLWLPAVGDARAWGVGRARGLGAEVSMSRKLLVWLAYAHRRLPHTPYIGKLDDDTYLRAPQFVARLEGLAALAAPARRDMLYFGLLKLWNSELTFATGMLYVLGRGAAAALGTDPVLMYVATAPYSVRRAGAYLQQFLDHEDVMVALALRRSPRAREVLYASPSRCAWHDVHRGPNIANITAASICVHRITPGEMSAVPPADGGAAGPPLPPPRYVWWEFLEGKGLRELC